ncbi:SusC/RagA family TonB-linked outer membrane protein [Sphingobacterium sp. ML3W]|uniref:TonB-dependent receptor n=1 Tax=Sphingobacterium sp. ML3W TaxID=1538644 RepID=UPI00249B7C06|nr:SusC/RagA family TonB-linked outer membrane protein [Sphingobacterium sp. ML3W]WFA78884.1 SusC/RagA family TonB-linked outer membrane protein [Sphingobacterium sp. ML3W]
MKKYKYLIIMKMIIMLLLFTLGQLHAGSFAQTVNIKKKNSSIVNVFREIKKQTGYTVLCKSEIVNNTPAITVDFNNVPLDRALTELLTPHGLTYFKEGKSIVVKAGKTDLAIDRSHGTAKDNTLELQKNIHGQVTDQQGKALSGVSVTIKGSKTTVGTDQNGNYSIAANRGATLVFSFLGYDRKEVEVNGETHNVSLQFSQSNLEEVVVTGYGTFKKSDYTGSASTIRTDRMADVPAVNFSTMLQGNAPGVQVNSLSGQPGGATDIRIRGMGSINASNKPLFVIDGVPVMSENIASSESNNAGLDVMSTINSSDIEQITVIKDAAAASLYGSRAAGGVILITTKSGKAGKPVFSVKGDYGLSSQATDFREVMDGPQRREMLLEGLRNRARYLDKLTDETQIEDYAQANIDKYAPKPTSGWADWKKELFRRNSPFRNADISASGGDSKLSYYTSMGYTNQTGLSYQSGFERLTGRLNVKYKMSEKMELGANILYSNITQDVNSEGGGYTSPIYSSRHKITASEPVYNEDGSFFLDFFSNGPRNPKASSLYNFRREKGDRSFNTVFANYKFIDGLVFNTTFSLDHTTTRYNSWSDPRTSDGEKTNGSLTTSFSDYKQMVWRNSLTYTKTLAEKHHLDILGGYEVNTYRKEGLSGAKDNFPTVDKTVLSNGSVLIDASGSNSEWRLLSYLSRANYNFDDKYFLGGSIRMDGSSRIHRSNRWGTFWSLSGAWKFTKEDFMASLNDVISDGKIRVSYGTNGTLPSSYYTYMDLTGFGFPYRNNPGIREIQIGNPGLKWEKQNNLNIGLDLRLFERLGLTFEWYQRQSSDLLNDVPTSYTTGFSSYLSNIGTIRNSGIELDLNADILRNGAFKWTSSLNFGMNRNKTIALSDGSSELRDGTQIHRIGQPWYSYYLIEFAGINKETGVPQYYINDPAQPGSRETTEDYTAATRILYKSADPKLVGGFTNTFRYKFLDLNFTWTYSLGGNSYDSGAQKTELGGKTGYDNIPKYYERRWQKPGDETDIEMFMVGNKYDMSSVANTRRVHSTDHIRLKNLTFGVSIPQHISRRLKVSNIRAFCSGMNLLTFAAYKNYDPEVPVNGVVYFESPKLKTVTFGLDVKF